MQQRLKSFRLHLRRAFFVPLTLAALLGATFVAQTYLLRSYMRLVEHSYQIQMSSRTLLRLILDMETSLRGFLLTGEDHFLEPYRQAAPQVEATIDQLRQNFAEDPDQLHLLEQIRANYERWHAYSTRMIEMRERSGSVYPAMNLEGKQIMDKIRWQQDELQRSGEDYLQHYLAHLHRTTTGIFVTAVALSILFGLLLATFARRELAALAGSYTTALRNADARARELHESQRWLGAVLGSIGDGVIATDPDSRIVFTNPVAVQILGRPREQIIGAPTHDVLFTIDEISRERMPDVFVLVMARNAPVVIDSHMSLIRPDGSEIPVSQMVSPIRGGDGRTSGVVIVLRDLSEQRRSERALRSTEKLASMGRLAASVAHEIHNPLDTISNLFYLIEHREGLDETTLNYIRIAHEELDRITNISEQMLTFSREARQPVRVKLSDILENVLSLYSARIRRQGIVAVTSFDGSFSVVALPGELRQVFSNLISNALDAMPEPGRLLLHVSEGHRWHNSEEVGVRVTVCDTGTGIPANMRANLMEPFVTSKGEKGTGLGLWVCRGIVEKYGGSLRFRTSTRPGKSGTCFAVFLPAGAIQQVADNHEVSKRETA